MPATAGRVRMPADNRLSVSDSLRTTEIWQKSVGYDPYAPQDVDDSLTINNVEEKAKGLFALARLTGSSSSITPGGCRKCGQVGHLTFQCRNYLSPQGQRFLTTNQLSMIKPPLTHDSKEVEQEKKERKSKKSRQQRRHKSKHRYRSSSLSEFSDGDSLRKSKKDRRKRPKRNRSADEASNSSFSRNASERDRRKRCRSHEGEAGRRSKRNLEDNITLNTTLMYANPSFRYT